MKSMIEKLVIYTDLDGTLLDHDTYDFSPALPLIKDLSSKGALIIPVTSKTRAETLFYLEKAGISGPFVVENGGAAYLPPTLGDMEGAPPPRDCGGSHLVKEFGRPVAESLYFLERFCVKNKVENQIFSRLTLKEIVQLTSMNEFQSAMARERSYDLPFILPGSNEEIKTRLEQEALAAGLKLHRGGRFLHLSSNYDKAGAVAWLNSIFAETRPGFISIGLGDAENDLEMLAGLDYPWLVRSPDAARTKALAERLPAARVTAAPGPLGWVEAVKATIKMISGGHYG